MDHQQRSWLLAALTAQTVESVADTSGGREIQSDMSADYRGLSVRFHPLIDCCDVSSLSAIVTKFEFILNFLKPKFDF